MFKLLVLLFINKLYARGDDNFKFLLSSFNTFANWFIRRGDAIFVPVITATYKLPLTLHGLHSCLILNEKRSSNIYKTSKNIAKLICYYTSGLVFCKCLFHVLLQPIYAGEISEKIILLQSLPQKKTNGNNINKENTSDKVKEIRNIHYPIMI